MKNYDKYNLIVWNYIKQNEVKGAIMFTAPWGSGKSYYVDQCLSKYLDRKKVKQINISLYGLSSIQELNNALFNNYLAKIKIAGINNKNKKTDNDFLNNSFESIKTKINNFRQTKKPYIEILTSKGGMFVSRLIEKAGFDLSLNASEKDIYNINKIIEEINNSKTLIILEDIERSKIDVLDLLGYINNLAESSNMKILLIVNENVFLKNDVSEDSHGSKPVLKEGHDADGTGDKEDWTEKYLKSKEKTIIDTIKFEADNDEIINNIIWHFDKKYRLKNNTFAMYSETIANILNNKNCHNYRILIFALQKVIDYFGENISTRNPDYFCIVLSSILRFSIQVRAHIKFDVLVGDNSIGIYDLKKYVLGDISVAEDIDEQENRYIEYINELNKDNYANDIIERKLKYWFTFEQKELEKLIKEILDNITSDKIKYIYYKNIMYFLLPLRDFIDNGDVIDEIKKICLKNIAEQDIDIEHLLNQQDFGYDLFIESGDTKYREYKEFIKEYNLILNKRQKDGLSRIYFYDSLDTFTKEMMKRAESIHQVHVFMKNVDTSMLRNIIEKSSSKDIYNFRGLLNMVYSMSNLKDIYPSDRDNIEDLKNKCELMLNRVQDKIKKQNIKYLINDLNRYSNLYSD